MVLHNFKSKMASDHPAKKKLRITNDSDQDADETDFITQKIDTTNMISLELSLPDPEPTYPGGGTNSLNSESTNLNARPCSSKISSNFHQSTSYSNNDRNGFPMNCQNENRYSSTLSTFTSSSIHLNPPGSYELHNVNQFNFQPHPMDESVSEIVTFENSIVRQCLCGVSEAALRKPFQIYENGAQQITTLSELPTPKILNFLSNLQLLFDVYLKQNNKGFICARLLDVCTALVLNEHSLVEQIFNLVNLHNKLINYLTSRVLASYFIMAKTNVDNAWLECVMANLSAQNDYNKLNFSIEIIKRIVEWKDNDIHVLEEEQVTVSDYNEPGVSGNSSRQNGPQINHTLTSCRIVTLTDHESFDTSPIKCLIIKKLEPQWPELVKNIETLITNNLPLDSEHCIINFLSLWENIISVRANLSVVETKPFYAHLEKFVGLLHFNLPFLIWRQFLSLFNEVLCYGSTLALQDILPEETCALAHLVVRYVKDFRLLDSLPYKRSQAVSSLIGTDARLQLFQENFNNVDKTLLQKMALLVLKSVAITVKETRSDSSDSSVGSDDYDFNQDMQLIERSIRDVLKKLDSFIKTSLEYHPECAFTKVLIHLFSDQDDYMIESMVCTLDITVGIFYRNSVFPDLVSMLNPFNTFVEFLKIVSQDSDVLLDYLVSNETCFLLYLLRFLKYARRNWSKFVHSCITAGGVNNSRSDRSGLDTTMAVLIRLRLQINRLVSKQLFPYNISPVLRLLETCESLYEGNEYT